MNFTIRQIMNTHLPLMNMKCFGCGAAWSMEHVLGVLVANGFDADTPAERAA